MPISFPFHRVAAAAALSLAFGLPSWAGGPPLTLAEALETAVSRSQQIAAQDAVITSAREQAVSAAQLPDPVLKLGVDNLPLNGQDRFSLTNDFMTMRRIGVMHRLSQTDRQARGASIALTRWVGAAAERMPWGPPPWQSTPLESAQSVEHLQLHPDIRALAATSNHRLNPLFADFYKNLGRPTTPSKLGKAGLFATTATFAALSCGPPSRFRRLDSVSAGCQFCRVVFARQSVNHGLCPGHKFTLYPRPPVSQVDLDPGYSGNGLQGFGDMFNT